MTRLDNLLESKVAPGEELPAPEERRRLRKAYGLSQAEVAEALGVKQGAVSGWERGSWEPRGETRGQYSYLLREMKRRLEEKGEDQ